MSLSTRPNLERFVLFVASFLLAVDSARGEFAVVQLITNYGVVGGGNPAIGWEFTPARPIQITKLGYFDSGFNGLVTSHELGIFSVATKSLVTSAVIDAGLNAPIEGPHVAGGGFRYVSARRFSSLPARTISLPPRRSVTSIRRQVSSPSATTISSKPRRTSYSFRAGTTISLRPGLEFPEDESPNVEFGPSFQFEVVPEPSAYALGAFALLGLLTCRRRVVAPRRS